MSTRGRHYEDDRIPDNDDAMSTLPRTTVSEDVVAGPATVQPLPCTGCVIDAKRAALAGQPIPEPLPGTVMIQGMLLCDVRHTVDVQPPSLLIAQPGQIPGGLG